MSGQEEKKYTSRVTNSDLYVTINGAPGPLLQLTKKPLRERERAQCGFVGHLQ